MGKGHKHPITATQQDVREMFDYDPDSGELRRKTVHPGRYYAKSKKGYRRIKIGDLQHSVHRVVWLWWYGEDPIEDIDHINRVKGDNRIINLRKATRSQNNCNSVAASSSGLAGVFRNSKYKRWEVKFTSVGKSNFIGYFLRKSEAAAHRLALLQCMDLLQWCSAEDVAALWQAVKYPGVDDLFPTGERKVYKSNTSGISGVTWNRDLGKWLAQIRSGGRNHYLGVFLDKDEAAAHRLAAEQCLGWHNPALPRPEARNRRSRW